MHVSGPGGCAQGALGVVELPSHGRLAIGRCVQYGQCPVSIDETGKHGRVRHQHGGFLPSVIDQAAVASGAGAVFDRGAVVTWCRTAGKPAAGHLGDADTARVPEGSP